MTAANVCAVVGGLQLPVHGLLAQDMIGSAPPNATSTTRSPLQRRQLDLVALSPHDSSPWALDRFVAAFGNAYRAVRVGEEIHIAA